MAESGRAKRELGGGRNLSGRCWGSDAGGSTTTSVILVQHWLEELKRFVATR